MSNIVLSDDPQKSASEMRQVDEARALAASDVHLMSVRMFKLA